MNFRSWLGERLGVIGYILYYILAFILITLPLYALHLNFWLDLLITFVIINIPIPIVNLPFWIWGFVVTLKGAQDWFAILYYIVFTFVVIENLYFIIMMIAAIFEEHRRR